MRAATLPSCPQAASDRPSSIRANEGSSLLSWRNVAQAAASALSAFDGLGPPPSLKLVAVGACALNNNPLADCTRLFSDIIW
jgi:hypothetical protein